MVAPDLVKALEEFHKGQIAMPETDTLSDGRDLVVKLQQPCGFPLCYVQRIGQDPVVVVWRIRNAKHAMENYCVQTHHC